MKLKPEFGGHIFEHFDVLFTHLQKWVDSRILLT